MTQGAWALHTKVARDTKSWTCLLNHDCDKSSSRVSSFKWVSCFCHICINLQWEVEIKSKNIAFGMVPAFNGIVPRFCLLTDRTVQQIKEYYLNTNTWHNHFIITSYILVCKQQEYFREHHIFMYMRVWRCTTRLPFVITITIGGSSYLFPIYKHM